MRNLLLISACMVSACSGQSNASHEALYPAKVELSATDIMSKVNVADRQT